MNLEEKFYTILLAVVLLFSLIIGVTNYFHVTNVKGEVTDKYTKRSGDHDKFYVVVKQDDGTEKVIVNKDSIFMLKFDSADTQAKIHEGKSYEFKLRGYRFPALSWFPNVDTVMEVK